MFNDLHEHLKVRTMGAIRYFSPKGGCMKRTMAITLFLAATLMAPLAVHAATKPSTTKMMMEKTVTSTSTATTEEVTPTPAPTLDYTLAYPGMLPDSPLYFLKRFRDWVMNALITDPVRKIDFYVLESDKDINAATFLVAKSEGNLAAQITSESTMYMSKAVQSADALNSEGRELPSYAVENLQKSLMKHEEVLTGLVASANAQQQAVFADGLQHVKTWEADMAKFK